jgi:hypothetical protein
VAQWEREIKARKRVRIVGDIINIRIINLKKEEESIKI